MCSTSEGRATDLQWIKAGLQATLKSQTGRFTRSERFQVGLDIIVTYDDDSPMRYPGGKGKTYQHIINLIPPHRVYIETHLGGGAVLRHKRPAAQSVGIDLDPRVIARWAESPMNGVEFRCERAEDFLAAYPFQGDELVYVDPPYHPEVRRQDRVYRHDYAVADHEVLLALLGELPCRVILSGYANSLYSERLQDWRTHRFQAKTHVDVREETLWFNFDPPASLHDARFMGKSFRARQTTKRRMQRLQEKVASMEPVERAAFIDWLTSAYPSNALSTQEQVA